MNLSVFIIHIFTFFPVKVMQLMKKKLVCRTSHCYVFQTRAVSVNTFPQFFLVRNFKRKESLNDHYLLDSFGESVSVAKKWRQCRQAIIRDEGHTERDSYAIQKNADHTKTERQVSEFDLSISTYQNQIISSQVIIAKAKRT